MEEWQRIAINGVVGFGITAGLYLLLGEPLELAVSFGIFAGIGFAIGIWLLGRLEDRRAADEE